MLNTDQTMPLFDDQTIYTIIKSLNAQQDLCNLGSLHDFPTIIMMWRCRVVENSDQDIGEQPQFLLYKNQLKRKEILFDNIVLLMGFLDKLVSALGLRKKEANVLVVGLDNSGLLLPILKLPHLIQ